MNTHTCQIIPFPDVRLWAMIAKKYVDYMVSGDPRAAYYFLEYELNMFKLSKIPAALKNFIRREYRKRGFAAPLTFQSDR